LSGKTVPAIAIERMPEGAHYAFDESAEITTDAVRAWVNEFLEGKLAPTVRSEEIPEKNDGPVKVVVAKSFESFTDRKKDVLLEFYAPC
jgi:protein disulfide-isomerase A1